MRRRAIIGALLLVGLGVVLGTTVFRTDIARATGLAQSVTVNNTAANPVPVKEQNLDGSGNIKVHEQGTANVSVTNSSLSIAPAAATKQRFGLSQGGPFTNNPVDFGTTINASLITITSMVGAGVIHVTRGGGAVMQWVVEPGHDLIVPLPQPLPVDGIDIGCGDQTCGMIFNVVGS